MSQTRVMAVLLALLIPLTGWAGDPNEDLLNAAKKGKTSVLQTLLDQGADVNAKDEKGLTLLMLAAKNGKTEIVSLLIKRGADVDAKQADGLTALSFASLEERTDTIQALLDAGASVEASPIFLTPDYKERGPQTIAIIQVEDARPGEDNKPDWVKALAKGMKWALQGKKYKVISLDEVREKLAAAGLTASQIDAPDPVEAGRVLAVDAVLTSRLKGIATAERVVFKQSAMAADFLLIDGKGRLLWKRDLGEYHLAAGWIITRSKSFQAQLMAEVAFQGLPKKPKKPKS